MITNWRHSFINHNISSHYSSLSPQRPLPDQVNAMEGYWSLCYYPILGEEATLESDFNLCEHSDVSCIIWDKTAKDFGVCFEYLLFSAFLGGLFGITSALYAGLKRTKIRRKRKPAVLVVRALISLCILIAFVVDFVGSFWLSTRRPYSVLLSIVVLIIAWSLHLFCIWVLSCSISHHGWGPLNLIAVWILLFVGNILQLRTAIRWRVDSSVYLKLSLPVKQAYFSNFSEVIVYVVFGLQCLYGLTIFFKVSRVTGDNVIMYPAGSQKGKTQWSDDPDVSVKQHLISSEWKTDHANSYGSITASYDSGLPTSINVSNLDASEDGANPLSLLSFWWVGPLMKRGSLGRLQKPEDLLQLPKSLKTSKIRQRFQIQCRVQECGGDGSTKEVTGQCHAEAPVSNESDSGNSTASLNFNIQEDTSSANEQLRARRIKEHTHQYSHKSLFKSLNRTFGLHYYPLGVLKLLADMLGFAGPLLLHALVSFMENRTVS